MRLGSLIRDLVIIVGSLYQGRMKAIRLVEVEIGSPGQITADGANACMQYTPVLYSIRIDQQRCGLLGLSHSCGTKAWSTSREKKNRER